MQVASLTESLRLTKGLRPTSGLTNMAATIGYPAIATESGLQKTAGNLP